MTDDDSHDRNAADVIEATMPLHPVVADGVVQRRLPGGTAVWSPTGTLGFLTFISEVVWHHLDGDATLGELAEDLAAATDAPLGPIRDHVTSLATELVHAGLVTGGPALPAAPATAAPLDDDEADVARGEFEEVRDGVRYRVTEIDVTRGQVMSLTGGQASIAELAPPDSCTGKRLHLDREAEVVPLLVRGRRVAVRTADPGLLDWLRPHATPADDGRGPAVALVTSQRDRLRVYDQDALQIVNTRDPEVARLGILGAVTNAVPVAAPDGFHEARLHLLHRGDRAVVAPLGALARPRGIDRQLAAAGISVAPTQRVFLGADGTTAAFPRLRELGSDELEWEHRRIVGVWARGNRPSEVEVGHEVVVLLRDAPTSTPAQREALLDTVEAIVTSVPTFVSFRTDLNALGTAGELIALFGDAC